MKFRDLKIGDRFCFASETTMPNSGMARGPWVKVSPRKYSHETDAQLQLVRVGSVGADVQRLQARTISELLATWCQELAEQAYVEYSRQMSPPLYLWGLRDGDVYLTMVLAREPPAEHVLVLTSPLPRHLTTPAVQEWLLEHLRREPVVPAVRAHYAPK